MELELTKLKYIIIHNKKIPVNRIKDVYITQGIIEIIYYINDEMEFYKEIDNIKNTKFVL